MFDAICDQVASSLLASSTFLRARPFTTLKTALPGAVAARRALGRSAARLIMSVQDLWTCVNSRVSLGSCLNID